MIAVLASIFAIVPNLHQRVFTQSLSAENVYGFVAGQNYTSTIVFTDPLVIYLDDFLSAAEIVQLLNERCVWKIDKPRNTRSTMLNLRSSSLFVSSQVFAQDTNSPQHRTSSSCSLPADDLLPSVVSARALSFLDSITSYPALPTLSYYGLEPLQLVKYGPSQHYHHHVDWFDALIRDDKLGKGARGKGQGRLYNRVASFFIYLEDDCVGGGTEFPDLKLDNSMLFADSGEAVEGSFVPQRVGSAAQDGHRSVSADLEYWRERIEIKDNGNKAFQHGKGTTFKPRKGSGVFWVNLHESGFGDQRVTHAGLPVREGEKVGMNIWVKRDFGW